MMSTEFIVTGGERPTMRVNQGDGIGFIQVGGSKLIGRDPSEAVARMELMLIHQRRGTLTLRTIPNTAKWCSGCGEVRDKSYFTRDPAKWDGLHQVCKGCDAARKRRHYAAQAESEGRTVRAYRRNSA